MSELRVESFFCAGEEQALRVMIINSCSHRARLTRLMADVDFMYLNYSVFAVCFGQFLRFYWDLVCSSLLFGGLCLKIKTISGER